MFTDIAVSVVGAIVLWLLKGNAESKTEIAVLKTKVEAVEKTHDEFKAVSEQLKEIVKDLTIAVEVLKSGNEK